MLQKLSKILKLAPLVPPVMFTALIVFIWVYMHHRGMALFDTHGIMATKERNLFIFGLLLSIIVVVPVFALLFSFAWRYREQNTKAYYSPELAGNRRAETVWWLIPGVLILILSVVTWNSSHSLDPFRPLASSNAPLKVQVISLDWRWLFIYPDQHVASINSLYIPTDTPIELSLTSDAPMNSFWVPQLSGQIYTMPGMSTQLHIMADKIGSYRGESANISGKGFSDMVFTTHAVSEADFNGWVQHAQQDGAKLTHATYTQLAKPNTDRGVYTYGFVDPSLYTWVIDKYMMPQTNTTEQQL